ELVEILPASREILVDLNLPVLVLVVAAEALLLARLLTRFGRFQGILRATEQRESAGPATRRRWKARRMLSPRLPQKESAGHQQEADGDAGKETQHCNLLTRRRFGTGS